MNTPTGREPELKMAKQATVKKKSTVKCSLSFEPANIDSLFPVLDALAWLDLPDVKQIAQFAGIDGRTVGKHLKNCLTIGIVQTADKANYALALAYPYKGSRDQKQAVIREALVRMPLMKYLRQFMSLGDNMETALRKAATVINVTDYDPKSFSALMKWATQLDVLDPGLVVEDLVEEAIQTKETRHKEEKSKVVAFLSHSSKDKTFIRQLAADLTNSGITVWLDEQMIKVGDSIAEKISQGLAESDYFLIALSDNSVQSEWVKKELNHALISEIEEKEVKVLPLLLSECEIPALIKDKKYADFSQSYKAGLKSLMAVFAEGDKDE